MPSMPSPARSVGASISRPASILTRTPGRVRLSTNGIIYTGTFDGNMVALDVTGGSVIWQRALTTQPIKASPAAVDDALYVLTPERTMVALDLATGAIRWESTSETVLSNWASAVGGGSIYIIADNELSLLAIDTATGETKWVAELGGVRRAVAYADGAVYVTNDNGSFYALDATDGSVLWTSEPFTEDQSLSPVVTPTLLIATWMNGPMKALDRETGEVIWSIEGAGASASPFASATAVYVVSGDQASLVAYDLATGKELGRMDFEGPGGISGAKRLSSPAPTILVWCAALAPVTANRSR